MLGGVGAPPLYRTISTLSERCFSFAEVLDLNVFFVNFCTIKYRLVLQPTVSLQREISTRCIVSDLALGLK